MFKKKYYLYIRNILFVEIIFILFLTLNLIFIVKIKVKIQYFLPPMIISIFFGYLYTRVHILKEYYEKEKLKSESANRLKSSFLSNMSHEIRTPLHTIFGSIDLAINEIEDNKSMGLSYLHIAKESAGNLLGIINNVLDLSKIESGLMEIKPVSVDIRLLMSHIYENSKILIYKFTKNIVLEQETGDGVPAYIMCDETKLLEILTNLVTNAIKFTDNGIVKFSVMRTDDNFLEFSVRDTGQGIEPENLDKIFNLFHQLDEHVQNQIAGSGLGLAIARNLVHLLGGELQVKSKTGESHGTCFTFTLPYQSTDIPPDKRLHNESNIPNTRKIKVLVAEDNILNQKIVKKLLEKQKIVVCTANNGEEAVAKFRKDSFDLILMDIQMPVLDGLEAIRQIRAIEDIEESSKTCIVAFTADANQETIDKCFAAGCDQYFAKPLDFEALKKYINVQNECSIPVVTFDI